MAYMRAKLSPEKLLLRCALETDEDVVKRILVCAKLEKEKRHFERLHVLVTI